MLKGIQSQMCAFYCNQLPSRTLALSIRGKQQVCASQRASWAAPQKQGRLQLDAGHNAPQSQGKNRDVILGNEDLEGLIDSIPHHDQIMHSIQEMYPSGMVVTY